MNRQVLFSAVTSVFITTGVFAQTKSKTVKEIYNTGDDTVLNITTSNVDIEFETWDKNQVEISATIELDGATNEEAERYFKNRNIDIKGNSKEIDISTVAENSWPFEHSFNGWKANDTIGFVVEPLFEDLRFPELSELSELAELAELVVIPELPQIPSINKSAIAFDYNEYKKDGDKYLKKWKKQFDKKFNGKFKKDFEAWGKKFQKLNEERLKELRESRKEAYEQRRELLLKKRELKREVKKLKYEKRRTGLVKKKNARLLQRDSLHFFLRDSFRISKPNIFYFSSDKENKHYKVKKTIKIKMPKSVKLKMNVRHGEVKLAATTKNLDASLQYASLLASTIEGSETNIRTAYSPIVVQKWNYGQLKTDYSGSVNLKEVGELRLNSVSSNIIIDKLRKSVLITNNLGEVQINSVSNNFKDIDVTVKNGTFNCKVPKSPITIYINGTKSEIVHPSNWTIERTKNYDNVVYKGFQANANSGKTIRVDSKYSDVILEN